MRPGGGSHKGSSFEREICKRLSLAWTDGERDDVFWRTSGSGARATCRFGRGKATANQYGDICATDPVGVPLTDCFVFELKCGYGRWDLLDLLDGRGPLPKFLEQATETARMAHENLTGDATSQTFAAVVIAKRDRRGVVVLSNAEAPFPAGLACFQYTPPWKVTSLSHFLAYVRRLGRRERKQIQERSSEGKANENL